jgi:hypothetical protein
MAKEARYTPEPLLPEANWAKIVSHACR